MNKGFTENANGIANFSRFCCYQRCFICIFEIAVNRKDLSTNFQIQHQFHGVYTKIVLLDEFQFFYWMVQLISIC